MAKGVSPRFEQGLRETVKWYLEWYLEHQDWVRTVTQKKGIS